MGFYDRVIMPRLIQWACSCRYHARQRDKIVPCAQGKVLEIGIGPGFNLAFLDPKKVDTLIGIDPSPEMIRLAERKATKHDFPITLLQESAEDIPLETQSVDTVLTTYALCTIPNPHRALGEMKRVLKVTGQLLFCEHGAAPDANILKWQNRIDGCWSRIAGGCHLNRPIPQLITENGFHITAQDRDYIRGPKALTFNYWGIAKPNA